jgi:hypothetical protein
MSRHSLQVIVWVLDGLEILAGSVTTAYEEKRTFVVMAILALF